MSQLQFNHYLILVLRSSILSWAGSEQTDWYTYIRTNYNGSYTSANMYSDANWNRAVHDGTFTIDVASQTPDYNATVDVAAALQNVAKRSGGAMQLSTYVKGAMGIGNHAANPMLQETPDPVSKITWDNYVTMSRADMENLGLNTYLGQADAASVVKVTSNGVSGELPAFMQPGQKQGTVSIALGYGRGSNGENIGKAAYRTGKMVKLFLLKAVFKYDRCKCFPIPSTATTTFKLKKLELNTPTSTQMHGTAMGRAL